MAGKQGKKIWPNRNQKSFPPPAPSCPPVQEKVKHTYPWPQMPYFLSFCFICLEEPFIHTVIPLFISGTPIISRKSPGIMQQLPFPVELISEALKQENKPRVEKLISSLKPSGPSALGRVEVKILRQSDPLRVTPCL